MNATSAQCQWKYAFIQYSWCLQYCKDWIVFDMTWHLLINNDNRKLHVGKGSLFTLYIQWEDGCIFLDNNNIVFDSYRVNYIEKGDFLLFFFLLKCDWPRELLSKLINSIFNFSVRFLNYSYSVIFFSF